MSPRAESAATVVRLGWLAPAVAAVAAATYVAGEAGVTQVGGLGAPLDDSWIHLQFASRLAAGDGLSYNPGRWVTGATAPLWTALLALFTAVSGSPLLLAKAAGIGLHAATAAGAQRLARALDVDSRLSLAAGVLTALSGWLLWSAPSLMEVPLASALSVWGLVRHIEERRCGSHGPPVSMALFALAVLARPEAALLALLAVLDRTVMWRGGKSGIRPTLAAGPAWLEGLAIALVVVGPTLVFYRAIGDTWLPSTYSVKAASSLSVPSLRYLRVVIDIFFRSQPLLVLACFAGALSLAGRLGTDRDRGLLPAAWLFGLPLAYSCLSPPAGPFAVGNFGRYYFPLLPILVVVGLLGIESAATSLPKLRWGRRRISLAGCLLIGLVALGAADAVAGRGRYLASVADVEASDVRAARWLAERLPGDALVAAQDIGAIKYFLPNRVLDLAGIVTPEVLAVVRGSDAGGDWQARLLDHLAARRPDVLVVFPSSYPRLVRAPGFTRLASFEIPGNRTMAGAELAIFETPWSRYRLAAAVE